MIEPGELHISAAHHLATEAELAETREALGRAVALLKECLQAASANDYLTLSDRVRGFLEERKR